MAEFADEIRVGAQPADEIRVGDSARPGTVKVGGVVEAADDPVLPGDHQPGDGPVVRGQERERPGPAGQRQRLRDHAAVGEDGQPVPGVRGGEALDRGADPGRERRRGLRARDHLPALLLEDLPDDRIALGHPLPVLAALPVAEVHLAQPGLHPGGQAEPGRQRRRGLRGAPQRAHVDRVDARGGQPAGQESGLLAPARREAGVGVPVHERERRARQVGLRLAVPDQQDVGRAGDIGEAGLRVAGRGHIRVFGRGHHAGSVMPDKAASDAAGRFPGKTLPGTLRRAPSRGGPMTQAGYDFVIVGGGSAGSALANRLSADPSARVLVLEAGRPDYRWDVFIHMPAALTFPIGSKFYDWKYESEPEPDMNGRKIYHARGKLLGGSSSINGMIFQRGNPLDYERWAADPGMASWDYAHCLPYFRRMENCLAGGDEYRGSEGPLKLERGPATNPLFSAFFEAVKQAGYELTDDVNGYRQEGFAPFDRNVYRGRRLSAARAYLHPVMSRPNLTVHTRAFVTKILFEGTRAVGVEYRQRGQLNQARAGQVILSGGAINSPQLLQLSGIGPASLLQQHGINVVADLPGVGENLQDHLEVYVQYACKQPVSVAPALKMYNRPMVGAKWLFGRTGPGATNHFEGGGFARSNEDVAYPNLMFHFLPIAIRYDGSAPAGGHGYQVHIGPMYSDSRGSVQIVSADPAVHPALRFNYLSTDTDRQEWVEAIGVARHILSQPALDAYNGGELSPGAAVSTPKQILDWVRRDGETALHPSCTCAMGTRDVSVVDPDSMAVRGIEGLKVVDASVMPYVTNGNIYAPVMMVAEKAADLILGNQPLPPAEVTFYRHGASTTASAPPSPEQTR